jgi:16S rRNA (uracil1498-N3)-methyltransferase
MNLFYEPTIAQTHALTGEEAFHAAKVLRLRAGERVGVTDGAGTWYEATVQQPTPKHCDLHIESQQAYPPRQYRIELALAPTKNMDRIEWLVEKATEMGVDQFSFFYSKHSERRTLKLDRLQKIAVSAMKQSLQAYLPKLVEVGELAHYLPTIQTPHRYLAHLPDHGTPPPHLSRAALPLQSYAVLIGPEGDFSQAEIEQATQAGFVNVTLGHTRLRTETAALVACQALHLVNI